MNRDGVAIALGLSATLIGALLIVEPELLTTPVEVYRDSWNDPAAVTAPGASRPVGLALALAGLVLSAATGLEVTPGRSVAASPIPQGARPA